MQQEGPARAYEWFLELPVPVVFAVLWLAGAALVVLCALTLYEGGSALVQALMRLAGFSEA